MLVRHGGGHPILFFKFQDMQAGLKYTGDSRLRSWSILPRYGYTLWEEMPIKPG